MTFVLSNLFFLISDTCICNNTPRLDLKYSYVMLRYVNNQRSSSNASFYREEKELSKATLQERCTMFTVFLFSSIFPACQA